MKSISFKFSLSVIVWPIVFLLAIWIVFWLELKLNANFAKYGVFPRTISGLKGVILSPFLHGDLKHLYNNSIPLFLLIAALRYFYREISLKILLYSLLFSGLLTWVIGRESYHIGASGLIYALISFILFKGLQTKDSRLVALSLTIVMVYGGLIWYVFPDVKENISWEGHLSGFIVGVVLSVIYKAPQLLKEEFRYDWQSPDFNPDLDPFMSHFDEHGNFVPTEKPEEIINNHFTTSINVIYDYVGLKKDDL